ncbi:MAG: ribonuclease R [Lachnospiraceae bacterium]|nr:ribonuclease R [Lachnospiraceae bacterium]
MNKKESEKKRKAADLTELAEEMGIPVVFPANVIKKADTVPLRVSEADAEGREDFREELTITIDGPDAKDLDDAVSLTRLEDGYLLKVHIADVSFYVPESSALDREAKKRGTSVYLGDTVIPMLPRRLSNGICSLNEGEDRLVLTVIMEFDPAGKLRCHRIAEGLIRVDRRMSYPEVREILMDKESALLEQYERFVPMLRDMQELAERLRARRKKRGAIDFDFPEVHFLFDEEGWPIEAVPEWADCATRLIEEFMLAANETVAEEFARKDVPFIYRVHEEPDMEKAEAMIALIRKNGGSISKKGKNLLPLEIQKAVDSMRGLPGEALVTQMILRSMQQARYSERCTGHFGLAARYYCHFTSPIRRYPDLQIHRIIRDVLRKEENEDRKMRHYRQIAAETAEHSSLTERRAVEAERESVKLLFCEYLSGRIGEIFDGRVSSVVRWGVYVRLPNMAEGLVHVSRLNEDYFSYDAASGAMVGRLGGKTICVGDPLKVRLLGVDTERRIIDFEPYP